MDDNEYHFSLSENSEQSGNFKVILLSHNPSIHVKGTLLGCDCNSKLVNELIYKIQLCTFRLVRLSCRQYKFERLLYVIRTNWKEKYQRNNIFVKNNINLASYRKQKVKTWQILTQ